MNNIAFYNIDYSMGGGVERVTSDLINLFKLNGEYISVMYSSFKINQDPLVKFDKNLLVRLIGPLKAKDDILSFAKQLINDRINILIYQADNMSIALAIQKAADIANIQAIAHYHGTPYAYLRKYSDVKKGNKLKFIFASVVYIFKKKKLSRFLEGAKDGIVCVSNSVVEELKLLFPSLKMNICAILNPQRIDFEDNEVEKQNIITLVSRLECRHKNAFLAVLVWERLAKKFPLWKFRFLGTGSLEHEMKSYFLNRQIENVDFLGFRTEVLSLLKESKIGVSTSNCEGFSMAVLEYILTGNAVICTNSDGGIHDMIIADKTGLIVDRNNVEAMANSLESLIVNTELREKFIMESRKHIKELYQGDIYRKWKVLFS